MPRPEYVMLRPKVVKRLVALTKCIDDAHYASPPPPVVKEATAAIRLLLRSKLARKGVS